MNVDASRDAPTAFVAGKSVQVSAVASKAGLDQTVVHGRDAGIGGSKWNDFHRGSATVLIVVARAVDGERMEKHSTRVCEALFMDDGQIVRRAFGVFGIDGLKKRKQAEAFRATPGEMGLPRKKLVEFEKGPAFNDGGSRCV